MMKAFLLLLVVCACAQLAAGADTLTGGVTKLQIGVKHRPAECGRRSKPGDSLSVHYTGKLISGEKFDSSLDRGDPFQFTLGQGQVIKGWDHGMTNMCVGEKRKLKIPSDMGYGDSGSPPKIPGGATLVFDVELMGFK